MPDVPAIQPSKKAQTCFLAMVAKEDDIGRSSVDTGRVLGIVMFALSFLKLML